MTLEVEPQLGSRQVLAPAYLSRAVEVPAGIHHLQCEPPCMPNRDLAWGSVLGPQPRRRAIYIEDTDMVVYVLTCNQYHINLISGLTGTRTPCMVRRVYVGLAVLLFRLIR